MPKNNGQKVNSPTNLELNYVMPKTSNKNTIIYYQPKYKKINK